MPLLRSLLFVVASGFALAACAAPPVSGEPMSDSPPPTKPPTEEPAMTCQADKGQWAKGKLADAAVVEKLKADTFTTRVRVIKPNMQVTMDYREDRLNLDVDADNRVLAVRCG